MSRPIPRMLCTVSAALVAGSCIPRFHAPPIPPPSASMLSEMKRVAGATPGGIELRVLVDSGREAVVALAGPFRLPAASGADAHAGHDAMDVAAEHLVARLRFDWPVGGWVRGYQLDVFDANGRPMAPAFVHHFLVANFDRRQMIYPTAEKLVGIGRETGSVDLPVSMGVPLPPGQRIGMMAALHNEGDADTEVFLRLILRWTAPDQRRDPTAVMPVNLDVQNVAGTSSAYDLPPGRSSRAYEFEAPVDGRLLAISGHLHDHGVAVRLEDAHTNREIAEVRGIRDRDNRIVRVEQKKWIGLLGTGIRMRAGRRYRLVGDYDNSARDTLPSGAMAQMIAVFAPDDWGAWPRVDAGHPDYRADVAPWRLDLTSEEFMRSGVGNPRQAR